MKKKLKTNSITCQVIKLFIVFSFPHFSLAGVTLTGPDSFVYQDYNEELIVKIEHYTSVDVLYEQQRKRVEQGCKIFEKNVYCDEYQLKENLIISEVKVIKIRGLVAFIIRTTNNKYFLRFRCVHQTLVGVNSGNIISGQIPRVGMVYAGSASGGATAVTSADAFPQFQTVSDYQKSFFPTGNYHRENVGILETNYWYTVPIRIGTEWDAERNIINLPGFVEWPYETVDQ